MAKRKERTLLDLYNVTPIISHPEINPILRGSCRMQGPVYDTDSGVQTNTVSSQVDEKFSRCSRSPKGAGVRAEVRTCNVCFAPCSSCLHIMRALRGSRTNESSGGNFGENESKASLRASNMFGAPMEVDILSKLSSSETAKENHHILKPECDSDRKTYTNKMDSKGVEGLNDNISCINEANQGNKLLNYDVQNEERINGPCSSASESCSIHEGYKETIQIQSSSGNLSVKSNTGGCQNYASRHDTSKEEHIEPLNTHVSSLIHFSAHNSGLMDPIIQNAYSRSSSGSGLSFDPNLKELEENLCSSAQGELTECSTEHVNSSPTKNIKCENVLVDNQYCKVDFVGGGFETVWRPKLEAETEADINGGKHPAKTLDISEEDKKFEVARESLAPSDVKETSLQSQSPDESESEVLEHDVKVCDICGDAGREDLLAVCSRCTDGAEHTYCMREMLDRVPAGDWLCEECKFDEDMKNKKKDRINSVHGKTKSQSSGEAGTKNTIVSIKLEAKGSDIDGSKNSEDRSSVKVSGKKHADDAEVSSLAKKQAIEPIIGSPKKSGPNMVALLSRDGSFKNLDRGKAKALHQPSSGTRTSNDIPAAVPSPPTAPVLQTPRGTFVRLDSFNSNAKPKVKLVDEVIPQKQKLARESASLDTEEGTIRLGKSMSFKSANSGRLNTGESKVKMLSPKFSHLQEPKGLRQTKERNSIDRRNSFNFSRPERPLVNSATLASFIPPSRVEKKEASHSETSPHSPLNNSRELKAVQSDNKLITFCKQTSNIALRGIEMPVSAGEIKRQMSFSSNVIGSLSANGSSSEEQKLNLYSQKDVCSSSSSTAERPSCNGNDNDSIPDGISRLRESTNLVERFRESGSRSREDAMAGVKGVQCQKCKQVGHSTQACTDDSPRSLAPDASAANDKLKAALEAAAMLKKPGIYKRNKVSDQSDELSALSIDDKISSQDRLASSGSKSIFAVDVQAVSHISTADCGTEASLNTTKQHSMLPSADLITSRVEDAYPTGSSDGKFSMRELPNHASIEMPVCSKMSVIPEHEYIWQGAFEVKRSGKILDLRDGIQAHLSTRASPKVLDASKKFPQKIILNEVPRLSTWPIQFQENGVKEDNIALYFFARDLESYEKSYKILLEGMMKGDLALRGHLDGVELLIFPSSQLPEQSQRWNMFFFLWGVFRAKRVCDFTKEVTIPRYTPRAIMSLPENICSLGPLDKDLVVSNSACFAARAPDSRASAQLPHYSLSQTINLNSDTLVSSSIRRDKLVQIQVDQDNKTNSSSLSTTQPRSMTQPSSMQLYRDLRCATSLEGDIASDCKLDAEIQACVQATRTISYHDKSEQAPVSCNIVMDRNHSSSHFNDKFVARTQEVSLTGSNISDKMNCMKDELKSERSFGEESLGVEAASGREVEIRYLNVKETKDWHLNYKKRSRVGQTAIISEATAGTSQAMKWNAVDGGNANKRQRVDVGGLYECDNVTSSSGNIFTSQRYDVSSSSQVEMKNYEGRKMTTPQNSGNAERYLFPAGPQPAEVIDIGGNSISWRAFRPKNEEWVQDRTPNLELALGAESKTLKQDLPHFLVRKADKKIDLDQFPDEATGKEEEDDVSASLSLSLSFPFQDKELAGNPVSRTEQLLPERRHVSNSLLFFGGLSDK